MRLPFPPYGWILREKANRSILSGFEFTPWWPLVGLVLSFLGGPGIWMGLAERGFGIAISTLGAILPVGAATVAAFFRGFRLEISSKRIVFWRTLAGIPYWWRRVRPDAHVALSGGFGDPYEEVIIENTVHSEEIIFGTLTTCAALHHAVVTAQKRWRVAT